MTWLHRPRIAGSLPLIAGVTASFWIGGRGLLLPIDISLLTAGNAPLLLIVVGLALCWSLPTVVRGIFSAAYICALFAFALTELWASASSAEVLIGGFIPKSDAANYYQQANVLLETGRLGDWGTRRPIASTFLASLYYLCGKNWQFTLICLGTATALATWACGARVRERWGSSAAAVFVAIVFLFYQRFFGTSMSEGTGLTFGLMAVAVLLGPCSVAPSAVRIAGSLFLFTLGLVIRAGPFLLLPTLALGSVLLFRKTDGWRKTSFWVFGGIVAGFAANALTLHTVGARNSVPFSNYSYTVYGIVHGGNWTTVLTERPEIFTLPVPEQPRAIYRATWETIQHNPLTLVRGLWRALDTFIGSPAGANGPYGFIKRGDLMYVTALIAGLGCLVAVLGSRQNPHDFLLLFLLAGVIASVPFAPTWDSDGMRVYAVAVPILALLPTRFLAGGQRVLSDSLRSFTPPAESEMERRPEPVIGLSIRIITLTLVFLAFAFPLGGSRFVRETPLVQVEGDSKAAVLVLHSAKGQVLELTDGAPLPPLRIKAADFLARLGIYGEMYGDEAALLKELAQSGIKLLPGGSTPLSLVILRSRPESDSAHQTYRGRVVSLKWAHFFVEDGVDPRALGGAR